MQRPLQQSSKEEENNIKLLHQLKKAHQTIDEMKRVIEKADRKIKNYKKQIEELKNQQTNTESLIMMQQEFNKEHNSDLMKKSHSGTIDQ